MDIIKEVGRLCTSNHILLINNTESIRIEQILNEKFEIEKVKKGDDFFNKNSIQLIILGCNFNYQHGNCINNFLFLIENANIPSVIVRPFFVNEEYKIEDIYNVISFNYYNFRSQKTKIIRTVQHLLEYDLSSRMLYHPTDPVFKALKIQKYLFENPINQDSLNSLSSRVNFSASWLSFKFKEVSGISLNEFVTKIKFCDVLWQLLSTEKLIKTIAFEHGYKPQSFTQRFYNLFGIPPSLVRNRKYLYKNNNH